MGWYINLISCDVVVDKKTADQLKKKDYDETFDNFNWSEGELPFDPDHMEHMDWLSNRDDLVQILKKAKVKGRVLFCSHEGDNSGEYWGHEFDGKGGYFKLVGKIGQLVWKRRK